MMVDLPSSDPLYPNIAAFRKKHAELRGRSAKPNGNTIIVADILLLVKNVGQSLGGKVLDKDALRNAIEGTKDIPGLQGIWNLSATNHGNSFAAGTVVLTNSKGRMETCPVKQRHPQGEMETPPLCGGARKLSDVTVSLGRIAQAPGADVGDRAEGEKPTP
jgi:hypothetical protein